MIKQKTKVRKLVICEFCKVHVRQDRIEKHLYEIHFQESIAKNLLIDLENGVRHKATETERCDVCRRQVTFLIAERNIRRAFDVDKNKFILGRHACNAESHSESIYTYSGGAVDSNRRRH